MPRRLPFGNYRRDGDGGGECNAIPRAPRRAVNPMRKFPAFSRVISRRSFEREMEKRRRRKRSAGNSTDLTAGTILIDDLKREPATAAVAAAVADDDDDDLRAEFPTRLFVARVAA